MTDKGFEFENQEESEIQEGDLTLDQISQAVLYSSDWTTETIISQIAKNNIDLNPKFQRRDAWRVEKKSRLIESIVLGLPIPSIVLAEKKTEKGKFLVLDGKQRLLAIMQFTGNAPESNNNNFSLSGLDIREDLNGVTYEMLAELPDYSDDIDYFNNQTIRTVVIRNWPNNAFLHTVFIRLNISSSPLSPQELRQALYPGPFVEWADDAAYESVVFRELLGLDAPDFRMRDVELVIRFLAFHYYIEEYSGNLRAFLDTTCDRLNQRWEINHEEIQGNLSQFEEAITLGWQIFGKDGFGRKWVDGSYQSRLNRAVIDVMVFYFSDPAIRELARPQAENIELLFRKLCEENEEFVSAIEATTKSISATFTRFSTWGDRLRQLLDSDFPIVELDPEANRMVLR